MEEHRISDIVRYWEFPFGLQKTIPGRKFLYILPFIIDKFNLINLLISAGHEWNLVPPAAVCSSERWWPLRFNRQQLVGRQKVCGSLSCRYATG